MIETLRTSRRAVTILEMIVILPLILLILYTAAWGYSVQTTTQRRIAEQAHRQAIMRAVLNNLRVDMTQAGSLEYEAAPFEAGFDGEEHTAFSVNLTSSRGTIRYELLVRDPIFNQAGTTMAPPPPERTVVRTDVDGSQKTWSLFGLVLTVEPPPGRDGDVTSLAIQFHARLRYDTGTQTVRTYHTTLRLGGRP